MYLCIKWSVTFVFRTSVLVCVMDRSIYRIRFQPALEFSYFYQDSYILLFSRLAYSTAFILISTGFVRKIIFPSLFLSSFYYFMCRTPIKLTFTVLASEKASYYKSISDKTISYFHKKLIIFFIMHTHAYV